MQIKPNCSPFAESPPQLPRSVPDAAPLLPPSPHLHPGPAHEEGRIRAVQELQGDHTGELTPFVTFKNLEKKGNIFLSPNQGGRPADRPYLHLRLLRRPPLRHEVRRLQRPLRHGEEGLHGDIQDGGLRHQVRNNYSYYMGNFFNFRFLKRMHIPRDPHCPSPGFFTPRVSFKNMLVR